MAKLTEQASVAGNDLAGIKSQLEHVPTKLNMWTAVAAIILPVAGGIWWIVQQYLGPLLSKAAGT